MSITGSNKDHILFYSILRGPDRAKEHYQQQQAHSLRVILFCCKHDVSWHTYKWPEL